MTALSTSKVNQYKRDGYLSPLDVCSPEQAALLRQQYESCRHQATNHSFANNGEKYFRTNAHLVLPFVSEVARTPALLDMVSSILGPNLLLWSAEFFVKDARSPKIVSWHQDLTYWGLGETEHEFTAWIALSEVNVASGCMQFIPGSHHQQIQPHMDTFDDNNLLSRGQEIAVDVDKEQAVNIELRPGQASFHHGRMFHASGPNVSEQPRIGLVLRYLTPEVKQLVGTRDYAMQMKGLDSTNHWIHIAPPSTNFQPQYLDIHTQVRADQIAALAQGAKQTLNTEKN